MNMNKILQTLYCCTIGACLQASTPPHATVLQMPEKEKIQLQQQDDDKQKQEIAKQQKAQAIKDAETYRQNLIVLASKQTGYFD